MIARRTRTAVAVLLGLLAFAFAATSCSGARDDAGEAAPAPAEPVSAEAPAADEFSVAKPSAEQALAASTAGTALPAAGPRVIQTAFLKLVAPAGRFEEVVSRARTVASGFGGFVTSSSASQGDESELVRGTLVVRVPERHSVASATFVGVATVAPILLLVGVVGFFAARGFVAYRRRARSGRVPTVGDAG